MIKQLRKRHLQIWLLLAVLIPLGIIVAWMAVPRKVTQELLQQKTLKTINDTIVSVDNERYKINILFDGTIKRGTLQTKPDSLKSNLYVEVINKSELPAPSLLLYQVIDSTTNDIDKQEILGRIEGRGSHYFSFYPVCDFIGAGKHCKGKFILYDIIKKQIVDTLNFKFPFQRIFL